ncbi:uncharacterized protein EV154DRAFT_497502 [Mucor mucedo]|uniref:uncharacterized protein n=1 Tax=Mucor mucedo TaxID=29922 RepID=UPI00221F7405|nr:uncharacterized protein EV154DRAFT_497502 [Mucor mucedo]KAI7894671.1 hypothetical protein EV154DRAFT_497502 [Mucor mucedo]
MTETSYIVDVYTTPDHYRHIVSYFRQNRHIFKLYFNGNQDGSPISSEQTRPMLQSLKEDGIIPPSWKHNDLDRCLKEFMQKYRKLAVARTKRTFKVNASDLKKGITTTDDKLDYLIPDFYQMLELQGLCVTKVVAFHGAPTGTIYTYPNGKDDYPWGKEVTESMLRQAQARKMVDIPTTDRIRPSIDPATGQLRPPTRTPTTTTTTTSQRARPEADTENESWANQLARAKRARPVDEGPMEETMSDYSYKLELVKLTLEAFKNKTFGDVSLDEVTNKVRRISKAFDEDW